MSTPRSRSERKNEKVLTHLPDLRSAEGSARIGDHLTQPTALFILDFDYKNQKNYVDFVFYDLNTLKEIKRIKKLDANNLQVFDNGKKMVACDENGIYVAELYHPEKSFYIIRGNNKSLIKDYDFPVVLRDRYIMYWNSSISEWENEGLGNTLVVRYDLVTRKKKIIFRKKGYSAGSTPITKFSNDLVVVKGFDEEPLLLNCAQEEYRQEAMQVIAVQELRE